MPLRRLYSLQILQKMKHKCFKYMAGLLLLGLLLSGLFLAFPLQKQQTFGIHYAMTMEHDLGARLGKDFAAQRQQFSINLDGQLEHARETPNDTTYWVYFALKTTALALFSGQTPLPEARRVQFSEQLARPFRAQYHLDGRIIHINCDSSISASVESVQRNIACLFQYPDKHLPDQSTLSREEADVSGLASVQYHKDIQSGSLQKVKATYNWLAGDFGGLDTPSLALSDTTHYVFDPNFKALKAVRYKTVRELMYNGISSGNMSAAVALELLDNRVLLQYTHHSRSDQFKQPSYFLSAAPYTSIAPLKAKHDKLRRILNGKSAFELLLEIQQLKTWDDALYRQAVAALSIYPQSALMYEAQLRTTAPQSLTFQMLSNALAEEHGVGSQAALNNLLLQRGHEWPVMYELLPLLTLMPEPGNPLTETVKHMAFYAPDSLIRGTAQLTLGGMVLQIGKKAPAQASQITRSIVTQLKTQCSDLQYLLVLGNTGNPEALPEIEPYLASEKHPLFQTALQSLRFMPGQEVSERLERYRKHSDKTIRTTVAEVLQFRT